MSQRRVILAGHSHAVALGLVPSPGRRRPALVPIAARGSDVYGLQGDARRSAYWAMLTRSAPGARVVLVWSGNQHLVRFLLAGEAPFDVCLARHPEEQPQPGVTLVPEALVRAILREPILPLAPLLRDLARRGVRPVVVGTPPPLGDDERLRAVLMQEARGLAGGDGADFDPARAPLTDRHLRRRLWRIVQDLLEETAQAAGATFVPSPAAAADPEGFLRLDLMRGDVSHANAAYGDLVWADLAPILDIV